MLKRVYIEITDICNLSCSFCPPVKRVRQCMSPAFFETIIRQVKAYTDYIYLHVQGEPLMHPRFEEIMDLCDRYAMQVQLVTNAVLLKDHADALLKHPSLRRISFSLQSAEYSRTDIQAYMDTILSFCEKASKQGKPECDIRLWREDSYREKRTRACLERLKQYSFQPDIRKRCVMILPHVHISFANSFAWPADTGSSSKRGTCHGTVDQLAVLADGTVVPCCLDHDGRIPLGSLHEQSFSAIYEGERCTAMREGFRSFQVIEPYCQTCSFRHRFDRSGKQK